ncbi:MAG: ABC transporter permease [Bacilli bacterium]
MNNIKITIKKELRSIIRDKKSLLMMALTPLFIPIFVILMSYMYETLTNNTDEDKYTIGINYNLSTIEKELLDDRIEVVNYKDINELDKAYKDNKIIGYLTKNNDDYNIYINSQTEDGSIVLMYLTSYLDNYNTYLGQNYLLENNVDINKVYNNIKYTTNELKGESIFASEVVLMAVTFTIMAITLSAIYASTDSTAGEKERGTLETILTFPISRKELILGKYFSISISGIITMIIGILLSVLSLLFVKNNFSIYDNVVFNINITSIILTIIILLFYTLFISGLCITIASFTKTFKEAQSALTPISLITCIPMFLSMLNINLNNILNIIPIVNHTIVINDILTNNIDITNILLTIISSCLYITILIIFISKIYKSEKILFS